jgi:hypothetical protein
MGFDGFRASGQFVRQIRYPVERNRERGRYAAAVGLVSLSLNFGLLVEYPYRVGVAHPLYSRLVDLCSLGDLVATRD